MLQYLTLQGLPLHLQVDTFDDIREGSTPVHRGYCQIKVFCDKVQCFWAACLNHIITHCLSFEGRRKEDTRRRTQSNQAQDERHRQ